jgi:hypothetical protein
LEAPYISQNCAETERLKALVARLSPEDYARDIGFGWTVGMTLAHLAYWDEFAVLVHARWQRQGFAPIASGDADLINDAALNLFRELPSASLKKEVITAAAEADQAAAAAGPDLAEQIVAGGRERLLTRYVHRRMHLDDIERALAQ